jgi:Kef-type K+ transport system membrane component KefB
MAAPAGFLVLLGAKMLTKVAGVYPVTRALRSPRQESMYTTMLMSTGLTFGTISALFGLSHEIITQAQYSALVAAVIGSAVVPTLIANAFFLPHHLLPQRPDAKTTSPPPAASATARHAAKESTS